MLILEPIFEADFRECSYGFRPGRKAHDALEAIRENLKAGRTQVYDADLKAYFDSIPHEKLMACVRMRVSARNVLELNRQKTGIVCVESGESLNFLGFTFRTDRDLKGRAHRYLNVFPSSKTIKKARERIREMTGSRMCYIPTPTVVQELNPYQRGWC